MSVPISIPWLKLCRVEQWVDSPEYFFFVMLMYTCGSHTAFNFWCCNKCETIRIKQAVNISVYRWLTALYSWQEKLCLPQLLSAEHQQFIFVFMGKTVWVKAPANGECSACWTNMVSYLLVSDLQTSPKAKGIWFLLYIYLAASFRILKGAIWLSFRTFRTLCMHTSVCQPPKKETRFWTLLFTRRYTRLKKKGSSCVWNLLYVKKETVQLSRQNIE